MGTVYKYKCNSCDFEQEYWTGGGFFTEEYCKETERLENELREDTIAGKYGVIIKSMLEADVRDEIRFFCGTSLFQCWKCKALLVHREKHIGNWRHSGMQYALDIDINQNCPECGSDDFKKLSKYKPICPKCKENELELISIGKWD